MAILGGALKIDQAQDVAAVHPMTIAYFQQRLKLQFPGPVLLRLHVKHGADSQNSIGKDLRCNPCGEAKYYAREEALCN